MTVSVQTNSFLGLLSSCVEAIRMKTKSDRMIRSCRRGLGVVGRYPMRHYRVFIVGGFISLVFLAAC